jgi:transcriptional regulator with XRE-family HTH domain
MGRANYSTLPSLEYSWRAYEDRRVYTPGMAYGRPPKWDRSEFGKKLVAARLRLGLSQAEVASRVGVSQQAYAGWERRTMAIRPAQLARLAEVLAIGLDDLLGAKPGPARPEVPSGRAFDALARAGKLPLHEQRRLLDVIDDLLYAAERRNRR